MSIFKSLKKLPPDPIFGLAAAFKADLRDEKVNLSIGAYRDSEGLPYIFEAVKKAEHRLVERGLPKEYGLIEGDFEFRKNIVNLIFETPPLYHCSLQTIGATGALSIGAEFLAQQGHKRVYCSDPTWSNHIGIFKKAGFDVQTYPYYDAKKKEIDFQRLLDKVGKMQAGEVMLIQACCHNPTGCDPTEAQWYELHDAIKKQGVIPFFDVAYQGLGRSPDSDIYPLRLFSKSGTEMFIAYSFAKNMGLYGERIGALLFLTDAMDVADVVMSHLRAIVRASYSNPSLYPARVVNEIFADDGLKKEWLHELKNISSRIPSMRSAFVAGLMTKIHGDFSFMERQKGMFSLTGLSAEQAEKLKEEHAVFILKSGRINFAGLTVHNIEYVIDSFAKVLHS